MIFAIFLLVTGRGKEVKLKGGILPGMYMETRKKEINKEIKNEGNSKNMRIWKCVRSYVFMVHTTTKDAPVIGPLLQ